MVNNPFASERQTNRVLVNPPPRRHGLGTGCTILLGLGFIILVNVGLVWIVGSFLVSVPDPASHGSGPVGVVGRSMDHPTIRGNNPHVERPNGKQETKWVEPTMPPRDSSSNTAGFIHIGKTAGSTISFLLRNGCTSFKQGPCRNVTDESSVSKYVEHYYHVPDFFRLPDTKHEAFIFSVRDVYDRTVSAFLYHHPANAKVYDLSQPESQKYYNDIGYSCFPSLEDFAVLVNGVNKADACNYPHRHNVVATQDCSALACAVLHGKVRKFQHLFFNYQNILYTKIPNSDPPRKIYSLRQEALWDDWKHLNQLLGQQEPVAIPSGDKNLRNVTGFQLPVSRDISQKARQMLCQALEAEYIAYFKILKRSINLKQDDLEKSRLLAAKNCPILDTVTMLQEA